MKSILSLIMCLFVTFAGDLDAMSIGRDGQPFYVGDVQWQAVKFEDKEIGFTANIPGSPKSGLSNADVFSGSTYQNIYYEINTELNARYTPPKTSKEFLKQVSEAYSDEATVQMIPPAQANVKYIADVLYHSQNKLVRVLCSRNQLYYAIVEGSDLSLAHTFFNSIIITK